MLQVAAEELIECPGCGTLHHGVCISELGHCTVMGCAQPITREALPLPQLHESPARRRVREQLNGRVRSFLGERARAAKESDRLAQPALDLAARSRRALWIALGVTIVPGVSLALGLTIYHLVPVAIAWAWVNPGAAAGFGAFIALVLGLSVLLARSAAREHAHEAQAATRRRQRLDEMTEELAQRRQQARDADPPLPSSSPPSDPMPAE